MTRAEYERLIGKVTATPPATSWPVELRIDPVPKPRMTQRDRWMDPPRPEVARYYDFCRTIQRLTAGWFRFPDAGVHVTFFLPIPKKRRRGKYAVAHGAPHASIPDVDNLTKALLDALHVTDAHIWDMRITKRWGNEGRIIINLIE